MSGGETGPSIEELQAAHDGVHAPLENPQVSNVPQTQAETIQPAAGGVPAGGESGFGALLKKIPGFGKK